MKYLFLLMMLSCPDILRAQNYAVGLRGGGGYWLEAMDHGSHLRTMEQQHISTDMEVFVRRTGKKRWGIEGAVGTSRIERTFYPYSNGSTPISYINAFRNFELSLSVQYDLIPECLRKCKALHSLHSYAGILMAVASTQNVLTEGYQRGQEKRFVNHQTTVWTGVSNTLSYNILARVQLIAHGYLRIAPAEFSSSHKWWNSGEFNPAAKAGIQLGAAYRF